MEDGQEQLLVQEQEEIQPVKPERANLQNKEMKIFLFEFLGTALFAYGILCSKTDAQLALFFLATVCFSAPFSGAHVNPAVTASMLLCRKINFGLAIIYWIAQIAGAFVGAAICYIVLGIANSPTVNIDDLAQSQSWLISDTCGEILATFTFITFILIQAHPDTTFTPDAPPLTTYCLVSLSLYISRGYTTHSGGCLNPGMALSLSAFHTYATNEDQMQYLYIWVLGPLLGGALASIFYEGIFKKLQNRQQ